MIMKKIFLLPAIFLLAACGAKWEPLFNGKDLSGWHQVTGEAPFTVEDGCIVTTGIAGNVNSFLAADKEYGDFILEFEFKMEEGFNSGVQFRGHLDSTSRVYGYQFEHCGNAGRSWTGGIYDERRRGWLYKLTWNPEGRAANRLGEWNKVRIEAVGNHLRTFVNGVLCSDVIDDYDASGIIALQSHAAYSNEKMIGQHASWRNIRICTENPGKHMLKTDGHVYQYNWISNTLSERQKAEGWKLLWDGKTTEGWRSAKGEAFPEHGWHIENGELVVESSDGAEARNGGDIITVDQYRDFWLSVDFKITPGANSGIKYFVRPDLYNSSGSAIGCEFQILDDKLHPDAKKGVEGNRTLASLYDLIRADKQDAWFYEKQWNTAWVIVEGNHVEHYLNGVKVVEYERNTQEWNALVAYSKYKNWDNFGNHETGHILLQDHGDEVHFKNILIKEL